jgi:hypothetical protein
VRLLCTSSSTWKLRPRGNRHENVLKCKGKANIRYQDGKGHGHSWTTWHVVSMFQRGSYTLENPFFGGGGGGGGTFKFAIIYVEISLKIIERTHLTNL